MLSFTSKKKVTELSIENPVAYFCAEYGINDTLPIYSGGLGVLAGDIVQEAAQKKMPFVAIGLFYKMGYFHQHIDIDGQEESVTQTNPAQVPMELIKDAKGETLLVEVPIQDRIVYAQIWRFPVGENSLYLLDTDHWKNNEADKWITDQLYGGGQDKRIQQEAILGIGGFRFLKAMGIEPSIYHMNEGHSAFLSLELIAKYLAKQTDNHDIEAAVNEARRHLLFTNHTLVPAGNDVFPHDMIRNYLGKFAFESGISIDTVLNLGNIAEKPGFFAMTNLALKVSRQSNAVSKLHALKAVDLWPDYKLESVTNGVHLPAWVAPELQEIWENKMPNWQNNSSSPKTWKALRSIPFDLLWNTHNVLKARMLDEVYARTGIRLDDDKLTVVWARRFATYKRPDLLFSDIERLKALLFSADKPIQVIVSGKSHPADGQGKQIIEHIDHLANYELKHRAVFVDDYSISLARLLVSGADVWLNTPIFGLEASGTSGMKASANGVVQFTTPDGWAYEVDWYGIGYTLPLDKAESEIYNLFEKKIIPSYYHRNRNDIPELWVQMMLETITNISPQFSSQRMVEDYVNKMYLPLLNDLQK